MKNKASSHRIFAYATTLIIFLLVLPILHSGEVKVLSGQVFIRSNAGETIKLSLVEVLLFQEKEILQHLKNKSEIAQPFLEFLSPLAMVSKQKLESIETGSNNWLEAIEENEKYVRKVEFLQSSFYYFKDLPKTLQITKTDADGKFSFKLPVGSYVLVAATSRNVGVTPIGGTFVPKVEYYKWMVRKDVSSDAEILLANDNLASTESSESMIRVSFDEVAAVKAIAAGETIETINAFIETEKQKDVAKKIEEQAQMEEYAKDPSMAFKKAVELYPELGIKGSLLNMEFVRQTQTYKDTNKEFLAKPNWPILLAKQCAEKIIESQNEKRSNPTDDFTARPAMAVPYSLAKRLTSLKSSVKLKITYSEGSITDVVFISSSGNTALDSAIVRHIRSNFKVDPRLRPVIG